MENLEVQHRQQAPAAEHKQEQTQEKKILSPSSAALFREMYSGYVGALKEGKAELPDYGNKLFQASEMNLREIEQALTKHQGELDAWLANASAKLEAAKNNPAEQEKIRKLIADAERSTQVTEKMFDTLFAAKQAREAAVQSIPKMKAFEAPTPVVNDDKEMAEALADEERRTRAEAQKRIDAATKALEAMGTSEVLASNWPAPKERTEETTAVTTHEALKEQTNYAALRIELAAKQKDYNAAMAAGDTNMLQGLRVEMRELNQKLAGAPAVELAPEAAPKPAKAPDAPARMEPGAIEINPTIEARPVEIPIPVTKTEAPAERQYGQSNIVHLSPEGGRRLRAYEADKFNMRLGEPDPVVMEALAIELPPDEEKKAGNLEAVKERFKELPNWLKKGLAKLMQKSEAQPQADEAAGFEDVKTQVIERPLAAELDQETIAKLSLRLQDELVAKNPGKEKAILLAGAKQTHPELDFNQIREKLKQDATPWNDKIDLLRELNYRQEQAREFGRKI